MAPPSPRPSRASPPSQTTHAHEQRRASGSDRSSLTNRIRRGACNYRDLSVGHQCGCTTFWINDGRNTRNEGGSREREREQGLWCICGHHACYHHVNEGKGVAPAVAGTQARIVEEKGAYYLQFVQKPDDGVWNTTSESQLSNRLQRERRQQDESQLSSRLQRERGSREGSRQQAEPVIQVPGSLRQESELRDQTMGEGFSSAQLPSFEPGLEPSDVSTNTGLPRIPEAFLLPEGMTTLYQGNAELFDNSQHQEAARTYNHPAGLGLSFGLARQGRDMREDSIPSTIRMPGLSDSDSQSIRPGSSASHQRIRASPSRAFIHSVLQARRTMPPLNVPNEIAGNANPEDVIQSATEAATPSNNNTPDLRSLEQTVLETKNLADQLTNYLSGKGVDEPEQKKEQSIRGNSPRNLQPSFTTSSMKSVPGALAKLGIHLNSIHTHLNSYPSVSASLKTLAERIDNLENISFSHVQAEEVADKFELLDGRLLELEGWRDDHDKIHSALDAQGRSFAELHGNKHHTSQESFNSLYSNGDAASSRTYVARQEIEDIKERLDDLESAVPTRADPWEVEVVYLPWGRELKGIWHSSEDFKSEGTTTQDTEEWTQARSVASSSRLSTLHPKSFHSGWSEQDIHGWADNTNEWLSAKACGPKNLAYKRLQSRGFVRNVKLHNSNGGDIQTAIAKVFASLKELDKHWYWDHESNEDEIVNSMPGLRSEFIPLRKALQSPRLRFLGKQEMSSSALWTAQFLAAGVMMRASGGIKRLFVTSRDAYLQQSSKDDPWTWQSIRELPRMPSLEDAQQVPEADAKEACWAYNSKLDPPAPSTNSSFQSFHSDLDPPPQQHASDPAAPHHHSFSKTSQQEDNSQSRQHQQQQNHPLSPLSEFPPIRTASSPYHDIRTAHSDDDDDTVFDPIPASAPRSAQHKRPLASSFGGASTLSPFHTSASAASAASASASLPGASVDANGKVKAKRRRVSGSPTSAGATFEASSAYGYPGADGHRGGFGFTPRRSAERSLPFAAGPSGISERASNTSSSSDAGVRVARSSGVLPAVVGSKRATTPGAYMTPFSGTVAGVGTDAGSEMGDTVADQDMDDSESWHGLEEGEEEAEEEGMELDAQGSEESDEGFFHDDDEDDEGFE